MKNVWKIKQMENIPIVKYSIHGIYVYELSLSLLIFKLVIKIVYTSKSYLEKNMSFCIESG